MAIIDYSVNHFNYSFFCKTIDPVKIYKKENKEYTHQYALKNNE